MKTEPGSFLIGVADIQQSPVSFTFWADVPNYRRKPLCIKSFIELEPSMETRSIVAEWLAEWKRKEDLMAKANSALDAIALQQHK